MTDEQRIRDTYRAYDESGRAHLWDRANPGYARLSDDRDRAIREHLARSLPGTASPRLLDVGCGDGGLIAGALASWPDLEAVGIDLLPDRIDQALARGLPARFETASADALPFPDRSFDVVSAITLFSSIPSPTMEEAAARDIGRVLRPGGWLVWYDLRRDNPWNPAVHGVPAARLAALFPGWERELRSLTLAPPIARRLGPLTPVAYPLLHALPPLRSHLVGRLRCPS